MEQNQAHNKIEFTRMLVFHYVMSVIRLKCSLFLFIWIKPGCFNRMSIFFKSCGLFAFPGS